MVSNDDLNFSAKYAPFILQQKEWFILKLLFFSFVFGNLIFWYVPY